VSDHLLVELTGDGRVSVGTWLEGQIPQLGQSRDLSWPLDNDALEDLRWYLEDYLRAPFGVYEDRGARIEGRLADWGQAVFTAVFGDGPGRDVYQRSVARQRPLEILFRSSSPAMLGLPWELMTDPGRPKSPLALEIAGINRSLPGADGAETVPVPDGRLRVLMVISRPAGTGDVGYQMIARPLRERLEAVRGTVDLVALRPPTLDALESALAQARSQGQPFHIVHFDGHGTLSARRAAGAGAPLSFAEPAEGILAFEGRDGGADHVLASRVAQVLAVAKVPVVVLNACQSGAVGKDLEAAVATSLLKAGIASVVAMAYSVYAVAAAEFMTAFYERLFAGETVTAAVTAGRRRLYQRNKRPSPKGEMPLSDWLVPVHYLRRDVSFPQARTERPRGLPSLDQLLDEQRRHGGETGTGDLDAVGKFIGRDDLFYQLEVATRTQKVVVLHGTGGTGKTELAKAFGRWWGDSGGVEDPDWVFRHSFEPGVASFGLDSVIARIGRRLYGADFGRLGPAERHDVVLRVLTERRMLLIWDNFESVQSMRDPAGATKPLDEAGCTELREFLLHLADHGESSVLITSRTLESWLGNDVRRVTVSGLARHEAVEYADSLLAPYPLAAPRRAFRTFGDLMEWLDGHPLSMRLVLPLLDTTAPETLLAGLQGTVPLPGEEDPGNDRTLSLATSISYSFTHLADTTSRILPVIGLLHGVADADVLALLSYVLDVPARFADTAPQDWAAALDDASRVGLLHGLGAGVYQIHPALHGYLAAWWREEEPAGHDAARAALTMALLAVHAVFAAQLSEQISAGDAGLALKLIELERRTMGNLLGYALDHRRWQEAQAIAQPLFRYWEARGLNDEIDAWADRVTAATEGPDGSAPPPGSPAASLWVFCTSSQAEHQLSRYNPDAAESAYLQLMSRFQAESASKAQQAGLATIYRNLGSVAQHRGRPGEAEEWYRKALAIAEEVDEQAGLAAAYNGLGNVGQMLGHLREAETWYRKAVAIIKELGDKSALATVYHNLGAAVGDQGRPDEAEDWYRMSLSITEELGDKAQMAATYHMLGNAAQERGELEEAESHYQNSLTISEELVHRPGTAVAYYQLGNVAFRRDLLNEAEEWYRKSLAIRNEIDDISGISSCLGQLGLLAEKRDQPQQALEWTIRCVTLFSEFPHPLSGPGPGHLARLTGQLGMKALEQTWQQVTGEPLPMAVRSCVRSGGADRRSSGQVKADAFDEAFRIVLGVPLPDSARRQLESGGIRGLPSRGQNIIRRGAATIRGMRSRRDP
jgi:tetratricopeptide (TPR) repeat protein